MRIFRAWFLRFAGSFEKKKRGRDFAEELESHLQMHIEDNLRSGMDPEEARRLALIKLGGIEQTKENYRERSGLPVLETLWQDARFGLRLMEKNPLMTAVIILTLALGIGANASIFSIVNAVLLRPLPYEKPRTLVWMYCKRTDRAKAPFSIPDFEDYEKHSRSLQSVAAFSTWGTNLTSESFPKRIQGIKVTGNFVDTLGVRPFLGRLIETRDDSPDSPPVVVLTHGLWQREFGGDLGLVGRSILLNQRSYTVIGVLPPDFFFPQRDAELASQLNLNADSRRADRGDRFLRVIGRLQEGVTSEQAESELTTLADELHREYPLTNDKNLGVRAIPMDQELIGNLRVALAILSGAVGILLLLACANLAHLLLARFSLRQNEMAIRRVLGATTGRLVMQLLLESCLLASAGALLGVLVARWCIPLLLRLSPAQVRDLGTIPVNTRVLLFVAVISFLSATLFGLGPALLTTRREPNEGIKGAGPALGASAAGKKPRQLLVVVEAALAVVLVTGAGLFAKSFARLTQVDPGFDAHGVLALRISLPTQRYANLQTVISFEQQFVPRLEALPSVQAVGMVSSLPLSGTWAADDFTILGRPPLKSSETPSAQYRVVSPGYFQAMAIPLISGRSFKEEDRLETRPVVVINQSLAVRFWPNATPLGEHLKLGGYSPGGGDPEIVGIVGNVKQLELDAEPTFDVYVPVRQVSKGYLPYLANGMWWVVRSTAIPDSLTTPVRAAVQAADSEVAASSIAPLERFVTEAAALRRFNAWLIGLFGVAALLLAALGIYGVIAFSITQRRREIGLRMVLGASPGSVLRLVVMEGMVLAGAGISAGILASLALSRWTSGLLYGVGASDAITLCEASGVLLGVALLASYIPARQVMLVDPIVALRYE